MWERAIEEVRREVEVERTRAEGYRRQVEERVKDRDGKRREEVGVQAHIQDPEVARAIKEVARYHEQIT